MKKWSLVGILGISMFAVCLGGIVALVPVANRIWSGGIHWNFISTNASGADAVEELRAPVDGPADLTINTPFGKVDISAEEGGSEIVVTSHKYAWGTTQQAAEDLLKKTEIVLLQDGNSVKVYVDQPVEVSLIHIGPASISVDFTVRVPTDCSVNASTSSGDVSLSGTTGTAVIHSSYGDVSTQAVRGEVSATTSSGEVTVRDVTAGAESVEATTSFGEILVRNARGSSLNAKSSSGDVTVEDSAFTGQASLSTSFGDIEATNLEAQSLDARTNSGKVILSGLAIGDELAAHSDFGDIEVKASSAQSYTLDTSSGKVVAEDATGRIKARSGFGDIRVSGSEAVLDLSTNSGSIEFRGSLGDGDSTLRTNFGDIAVYLPADAGFEVDLSTDFGDVECGFAVTSTEHDSTRVTGTVGAGGPRLEASTNSGDVSVQPQSDR
ncbi:MAG: DUF4097 family beta strand repeat protein [Anaerolineales bacterium]|nr:DUF4097 family beta strand repeat protein [Anaerolineales bacterium]